MKNRSAIILLLMSVGLFYTFTSFEYSKATSLHGVASQYQSVLGNVSSIVELRDNLLVAYEQFPAQDKARIEKVLPDNVDMVRLALELDSIASRYGIAIKDVRIGDGTQDNLAILPEHSLPYERAKVSFNFISNYDNLKRLLLDMEKSLRLMEIKSLSFEVDDSGLYEHTIEIETYWLKQ